MVPIRIMLGASLGHVHGFNESVLWISCLYTPMLLQISQYSFAHHAALALWVNAFMLCYVDSILLRTASIFTHTLSFGLHAVFRIYKFRWAKLGINHKKKGVVMAILPMFVLSAMSV